MASGLKYPHSGVSDLELRGSKCKALAMILSIAKAKGRRKEEEREEGKEWRGRYIKKESKEMRKGGRGR